MDLKPDCDSVNKYETNKNYWTWPIASSIFSYYGTTQFSTVFSPSLSVLFALTRSDIDIFDVFSVRPLTTMTVTVVISIGVNNLETPLVGFKYVSFMVLISFSESPHVACRINLVPMENALGTRLLQSRSNFWRILGEQRLKWAERKALLLSRSTGASRSPRFRHSSPKMRKKITHYKIDVTVAVLKISDNSEHAVMKGHLKKQKTKNKTNKKEKKKNMQ